MGGLQAMGRKCHLGCAKDSNIYQALNYMLRNYTELTNYIDIPDMPLDNNDTERLIRDMVMGKKAYLFCRDLDACKRAAMMTPCLEHVRC